MSATNFVSYDNASSIVTKIGQKFSALEGAYTVRGSVTFANLPSSLTASMVGYVYNVSDDFTTDVRFIEGAGKEYKAGTNVVIVDAGSQGSPDLKFDVIGSFVDVDAITGRIDALDATIADVFAATNAYAIGDIVMYGDQLYKFKAAHTANDPWSASEVDAVTVESLIASVEPDSLTTAQINALLALLD